MEICYFHLAGHWYPNGYLDNESIILSKIDISVILPPCLSYSSVVDDNYLVAEISSASLYLSSWSIL